MYWIYWIALNLFILQGVESYVDGGCTCEFDQFECKESDEGDCICIPQSWVCDGENDCSTGNDELHCDKPAEPCQPDEFQCASGVCIKATLKCNSNFECADNSDEMGCEYRDQVCESGQWKCGSGECIDIFKLCNSRQDCLDNSDETECDTGNCSTDNGGCSHICEGTLSGTVCNCPQGYQLMADKKTCTDFDECNLRNVCSQQCENTEGSYICTCKQGYRTEPGGSCRALGGDAYLLYTAREEIGQMKVGSNKAKGVVTNLDDAVGLDFHYQYGLIFWTDLTTDTIKQATFNGTEIKDVVSTGLVRPTHIAVDWIHDNIYWTDGGTARIEVSRLNGSWRKVLIWHNVEKPRALVLNPAQGTLFWTDWGKVPKIERASMDGSDRMIIANTSLFWPNGLAIDYSVDRLYWTDAKHHVIECSNLDGTHRYTVLDKHLPHPFSVTLFDDNLYWSDWQTHSINKANRLTPGKVKTVKEGLHNPMMIQTYHPSRQPNSPNKCGQYNGICSHLCLPKLTGFSCKCPTGFRLLPGETKCAENLSTFLLFSRTSDIRRISLDTPDRFDVVIPLKGVESAAALDWHSASDYIYWTDVVANTISRARWDGTGQEVIVSDSLYAPAGLAIDWITDKLYFTDTGMNRIEVCYLDGSMRSVLIWNDLDKVRDIVVHPERGFMFWTDWGDKAKIERSGMDGFHRQAIVYKNLVYPNGLAIDYEYSKIYWTDAGTHSIEMADLDGSNRQIVVGGGLMHPIGVTIHGELLYFTDWKNQTIGCVNKLNGQGRMVVKHGLEDLREIHMFHRQRPQVNNPCADENGGCSHLCLLAYGGMGHTCACPVGITLNKDGLNCEKSMTNFLVFARKTDVRMVSLDVEYYAEVRLPVEGMKHSVAVDVDTKEGRLYWADSITDVIQSSNLDGSDVKNVITAGIETPDGLAIDSTGRKIYWTDSETHLIEVANLDGSMRKVLIWQDLDSPRAIVLHYDAGWMYWTDWGTHPKIERADMDGSDRMVIVDGQDSLGWPNGLTIDRPTSRIIWTDARMQVIECADLNGENRKVLVSGVQHPYGLTVAGEYIYWTDWQTKAIHSATKYDGGDAKVVRNNLTDLMDIHAVQLQNIGVNRCGQDNGGCSHLCLPSRHSNRGFSCQCPTGLTLQDDGKTCADMPEKYLLFSCRGSIRRISMDTNDHVPVYLPLPDMHNTIALDFDYTDHKLYYTDVYLDVIRRSDLNGSNMETIVDTSLSTMGGIAVDWVARNIYWTDTGRNVLEVARNTGKSIRTIIDSDLDEPRAIALYPEKGYIFWTDWGKHPRIERAYMDGTGRKALVDNDLGWPNGLTIDYETEHIYWADASKDRIECSFLDGTNRRIVVKHIPHPFGLTLFADRLYVTDWQYKDIESFDKSNGNDFKIIKGNMEDLMAIHYVAENRQTGDNECSIDNGGCSHLCLSLSPPDYVCACPSYPDDKPCSTEPYAFYPEGKRKPIDKKDQASTQMAVSKILYIVCWLALAIVIIVAIILIVLWARRKRKRAQDSPTITFANPTYHRGRQTEAGVSIQHNTKRPWRLFRYNKKEETLCMVQEEKLNNQEAAALLVKQNNENAQMEACHKNTTSTAPASGLAQKLIHNPIDEGSDSCAVTDTCGASSACAADGDSIAEVGVHSPPERDAKHISKNIYKPGQVKSMSDKEHPRVFYE